MPKPDDTWQPPLLLELGKQPKSEAKTESHVEYDGPVRRRPAAASDEAPWWQRARRAEATVRSPPTDLSWGAIWMKLLASEGWIEGVRPGQRGVLEASIRGLDIHSGVIEATFAAAKAKPQRVQLRMPSLTSAEWARLVRQVLEDGTAEGVAAGLSAGKIPMGLVDAADRHKAPFIPRRLVHVMSACTCGGAQLPCDHVLAVHLALGRKLDAEPLALLKFRGGDVEELLGLVARIREETAASAKQSTHSATADPFAPGEGAPPDWTLLAQPPPPRPPLPLPETWRGAETLDAMVRRILDAVRARL